MPLQTSFENPEALLQALRETCEELATDANPRAGYGLMQEAALRSVPLTRAAVAQTLEQELLRRARELGLDDV